VRFSCHILGHLLLSQAEHNKTEAYCVSRGSVENKQKREHRIEEGMEGDREKGREGGRDG